MAVNDFYPSGPDSSGTMRRGDVLYSTLISGSSPWVAGTIPYLDSGNLDVQALLELTDDPTELGAVIQNYPGVFKPIYTTAAKDLGAGAPGYLDDDTQIDLWRVLTWDEGGAPDGYGNINGIIMAARSADDAAHNYAPMEWWVSPDDGSHRLGIRGATTAEAFALLKLTAGTRANAGAVLALSGGIVASVNTPVASTRTTAGSELLATLVIPGNTLTVTGDYAAARGVFTFAGNALSLKSAAITVDGPLDIANIDTSARVTGDVAILRATIKRTGASTQSMSGAGESTVSGAGKTVTAVYRTGAQSNATDINIKFYIAVSGSVIAAGDARLEDAELTVFRGGQP